MPGARAELSVAGASIRGMRTETHPAATLPPVPLTPEEAAAIAVALAARPDGAYADAGRTALEKVLDALEPDPGRRAQLLATSLWVSAEAGHHGLQLAGWDLAGAAAAVRVLGEPDACGRGRHAVTVG